MGVEAGGKKKKRGGPSTVEAAVEVLKDNKDMICGLPLAAAAFSSKLRRKCTATSENVHGVSSEGGKQAEDVGVGGIVMAVRFMSDPGMITPSPGVTAQTALNFT